QYQNWKEELSKLTTKDQINALAQKINQEINNKSKSLKREQNQKINKQQPIPLFSKIFLGIVVSVVILGIIIISLRLIRRIKIKKQILKITLHITAIPNE